MSYRCGAVVEKHRGHVGATAIPVAACAATARKRIGSLVLLILLLLSQWLAILPARAELAPVTESESRRCGFSNYSMRLDCSSYQSVFDGVDAFCKWWSNMEAYLAYSTSSYSNYPITISD